MLVDNCALFNNDPKPHAARTNAPGIRPLFPSTRLPRLACTTALTAVVLTFVPATAHAENPCEPTDEVRGHEENNPPAGTEITGIYDGCQYSDPGDADDATGVWSTNWSSDVNELTVRGSVEAVAGSSAGSAEARALNIGKDGNPWQGKSNMLINYATLTADAHSVGGVTGPYEGFVKSFGIYTDNWEGADNRLYNYGNIISHATGAGRRETYVYAIRTGEWKNGTNVLHNWGDLDVEVDFKEGGNNLGGISISVGIESGGWSGENHELINWGRITVDGEIRDNQLAYGDLRLSGFQIIRAISGSNNVVENHGELILTGTSGDNNARYSGALVYGFWILSDVTAEAGTTRFGNWGTISATATTGAGSAGRPAWATGIYTANLLGESNTLENHGTIVTKSTASDENNASLAYGLAFKSANSGTEVLNTGEIDVSINAPNGRAVGIGNFSGAVVPGEPGLYTPGSNADLDFAVVDGENVTTYRLYDAEIEQGGRRLRYFVPETFDGTVRNEGKVVARASNGADAFAIYLGQQSDPALDGWLELSTLGFLEGRIRTGGQNILVDNSMPSHSVYWTVEDSVVVNEPTYTEPDLLSDEPSQGGTGNNTFQYFIVDDFEQTTSESPPDWADDDLRSVNVFEINANTRATYDTSLMAVYGTLIDHAATIGSAQEAARLSAVAVAAAARDSNGGGGEGGSTFGLSLISGGDGENGGGGGENDEDGGDGGWQAWATGFGGQLELDGSDRNALDTTVPYTGLSAGIIRALGDTDLGVNGAVSFSFGSLQSNMDFNSRWMRSQESDVQTIFTGVAASFAPGASPAGGLQIGASLRVGHTSFDNTRYVNNNLVPGGIETNIGSTEALWVAVAGDIGYRIAAGDAASITPFARVSHVQGTIDGYSETGGQSAAIIGDQEIAVTRGEAGLRGSVDLAGEAEARLLGSVSAFFSSESGDDSVAVTLGTDTRDLVFTQLDHNGVRASLGLEYGFDNGTSLFAGGNYSASDAGDTDLSAGLTLSFPL